MSKKKSDLIFRISLIVGLLIMFALSVYICCIKQFWYDEVAVFGYVRSDISLKDMFHYYATIEVSNLPLFSLITFPLYHLLPANAFYMLIPSIVFSILASYFMVKLMDKTIGRLGAYITLVFLIASRTMISKVGTSYRAYSLMIFGSIFFIYSMYLLYQNLDSKKRIYAVMPCIAGVILAYSHYFGVLFLGVTGVGVIVLSFMKKMKWKMFIPFVVSALVFIPWFIYALSTTEKDVGSFWIASPSIDQVARMLGFLIGGSKMCLALWGIAVAYTLIKAFIQKKFFTLNVFYVMIVVVITGVIYIYSKFINPNGGLFEDRYFYVIFPYMIFSIVYFLSDIIKFIWKLKGKKPIYAVITGVICLSIITMSNYELVVLNIAETAKQHNSYEFFADRIIEINDIEEENTMLVLNSYDAVGGVVAKGWLDYYLIKRGCTPANVEEITGSIDELAAKSKDTIDTIYVFGDTDHFYYNGDDYVIVEKYEFEKGIVLKKTE